MTGKVRLFEVHAANERAESAAVSPPQICGGRTAAAPSARRGGGNISISLAARRRYAQWDAPAPRRLGLDRSCTRRARQVVCASGSRVAVRSASFPPLRRTRAPNLSMRSSPRVLTLAPVRPAPPLQILELAPLQIAQANLLLAQPSAAALVLAPMLVERRSRARAPQAPRKRS
jgi:hypothetical protein